MSNNKPPCLQSVFAYFFYSDDNDRKVKENSESVSIGTRLLRGQNLGILLGEKALIFGSIR